MRALIATEPGRAGKANEDFAAVAPGVAVLLDGAGSPADLGSGCVHSVTWYVRTLGALLLSAVLDPAVPLVSGLEACIERVNQMHAGTCDLANPHSPSATVTAARVAGGRLEYLVLADSVLVVERAGRGPLVVTDDRLHDVYAKARTPALGAEQSATNLLDHVRRLGDFRNQPDGFWVASTNPAAAYQALTGSLHLDQVSSVTLLSDGASRLADRFDLLTWPALLDILRIDGPDELVLQTRKAEAEDPEGVRWPRSKASDDATIVYWPVQKSQR